ncbi:MAG: BMP family ABC transporter substrate-binding protein, partial [Clostridia bacterium]|nr:BMP family ABC transporter substrate-binding protein [Clostridia bacterium]
TAIISSKINWAPYFKMIINAVKDGTTIPTDYCGTMKEGAVKLTELNEKAAAAGTQAKIDEVKAKLESGELKVFDTKTFTVDGKELTTYTADVVDEGDFKPETEAIENGAFTESSKRSAPYFDIKYIDGVSEL